MSMFQVFSLIFVGLMAGIGSGLFGIGGGVIIVPLLVFLMNYEQRMASATSLISMLLPVGILGVWQYYKAGVISNTHFKVGILVSLGMFLGALLGSKISMAISTKILSRSFSLLLVYVALRLWIQSGKS